MMKKIIICIFVILMFTGCKNEHNINKTEFLAASEKEITTADTQATAAVSEPTLLETAAETVDTSVKIGAQECRHQIAVSSMQAYAVKSHSQRSVSSR